ncbi:MAG: radical SAM protein, partial [Oscillospiraceae bacterium]|nr:radical SAM protein [Oscillospiraceae bacterium]
AIREISFAAGENAVTLSAVISAQEPTLNPDNLTAALRQLAPELAPDFAKFRREETYDADMTVFR